MAYRNAYQRTIKESLAFLVYGRDPVMPVNLIYSDPVKSYSDTQTYAKQLVMNLQNTFATVRKNLKSSAQTYTKTNEKWPKSKLIELGDMAYLHVPRIKENTSKKVAKFNQGPYRVIGNVNPVVFEIQRIDKPTHVQNVHVNRLIKVLERETFPHSQDISEVDGEGQESDGRDRKNEELDNNLSPRSLPFIDSVDDEGTEGVRCDPGSSSFSPLVPIPSRQTA
ncbi:hypothetical protein AVEN_134807-1 [Araneus ventricosus]|uniref:Integrase p58-like C-terminal domain-containing protein n=1 Tax=Araneus ventricosus TaxID=182803 RepID=A0A4Y2GBZ2_ARAVE|nr:hypothetical protein AVEN_134807-1 [Araneus ventricosus]